MKGFLKTLLFAFVFCIAGLTRVHAETTYSDLTNAKEFVYKKSELSCNINGESNLLEGSHILYGDTGTAICPATELFQNVLGVDCEFSISDCSITYTENNFSVKYTVGSSNALINGTAAEFNEIPVALRDPLGTVRLYIPSRAVAEGLGITYNWDKTKDAVNITKDISAKVISDSSGEAIVFNLFENVSEEDIRVEENLLMYMKVLHGTRYYTRQVVVTIPGEHAEAYNRLRYYVHTDEITGIYAENSKGSTRLVFNTSVMRACKARIEDGKLFLTFMAPWEAHDKIIIIDPGHGGLDGGANRKNAADRTVYEKEINLSIAYTNTHELFENSDIKAYYTRTDDVYLDLYMRRMLSVELHADMFLSIHQNTSSFANDKGVMVFYSAENNNDVDANGFCSEVMAHAFLDAFSTQLSLNNDGLFTDKDKRLDVTTAQGKEIEGSGKNAVFVTVRSCPAILIETGFMSNATEIEKLSDHEFQKKAGLVIFETVKKLFDEYPRVRTD